MTPAVSIFAIPLMILLMIPSVTERAIAPAGATPSDPPVLGAGAGRDDPGNANSATPASYALYLPSTYQAGKRWPILYCFDPGGRGNVAVELFRAAAERRGIIVAATNDFRSGSDPPQAVAAMLSALWNDTHARCSIDERRVYAAGFSGGGRVCWLLDRALADTGLAGIIEAGAGLPWPELPEGYEPSHLAFCGLCGDVDFNYYEMESLDEALRLAAVAHRLVPFAGTHRWPPEEACADALEWLEIEAMRAGRAPRDSLVVGEVYGREVAAARAAENGNRPLEALAAYRALVETFRGLLDVTEADAGIVRLGGLRQVAELQRKRAAEGKKAREAAETAIAALEDATRADAMSALPSYADLAYLTGIHSLLRRAASEDGEERLAARRVLEGIYVRSAITIPRELTQRKDYRRAALFLRLASEVKPEESLAWYRLAIARSHVGEVDGALLALRKALELRRADPESVRADPEMDLLRADPRFEELLLRFKRTE